MQYLTVWDIVLTPIYLAVLFFLARRYRDKHYPKGHSLHPYYLPGLWVKFGGVIFIALVYQFYYGGGDTFNYYQYSKLLNSSLDDSVDTWLKLLFRVSPEVEPKLYPYSSQMEFYIDPASHSVVSICAILGLFTFNTYIPTALLFAYISYSGIWAMYRTFTKPYPGLARQLAVAFLFIPSVFVWGSSIFKDTVCMFGLGWMTYTTFALFIDRNYTIKNVTLLLLSTYLVAVIKIYILLAFMPSLMLWLMLTYSHKIRSAFLRFVLMLGAIGIVTVAFAFFANRFSAELNRYSLDKLSKTLEDTRGWIVHSSGDEGSSYDLGEFEPTVVGMATKFPAGVAVTLFRPFLWESKKPIVLLSALESLAFTFLTLYVFYKKGPVKAFRRTFQNPNLLFFFTFSLLFAFAVGISTGNFGSLSRYKIPCIPFFAAYLIILFYEHRTAKVEGRKRSLATRSIAATYR